MHQIVVCLFIAVLFLSPIAAWQRYTGRRGKGFWSRTLRSTRRDSKRYVLAQAEAVYGRPVSWKKARKWANAKQRIEAGIQQAKRGAA